MQTYYCYKKCTILMLLCSPKGKAYIRRFVRLSGHPSGTLSGEYFKTIVVIYRNLVYRKMQLRGRAELKNHNHHTLFIY